MGFNSGFKGLMSEMSVERRNASRVEVVSATCFPTMIVVHTGFMNYRIFVRIINELSYVDYVVTKQRSCRVSIYINI